MAAPANRLTVGLVLDDGLDSPDGVQQYVLDVGRWLVSQGHEVHYLAGQTNRRDIPNLHSLSRNMGVKSNGNALSIPLPANKPKLRGLLNELQLDVMHVQTPYSPMMGELLIKLAAPETAVVCSFHILPNSRLIVFGTKLLGLWSRRSLRRVDAMLSVSPAASDFARQTFGIESMVSPNVIDYKRFNRAKPLEQYDDETLTILFLGRLVPRKGCQTLLEAIAKVSKSDQHLPKFRVVICGKGALQPKLEAYVANHYLTDAVEFVGYVSENDKPAYYASADISVFPASGGESFGIVLLEAMACGRAAVLAGDNPGYHSVMSDQPDLLFEPKNSDQLADKLITFMLDAKKRREAAKWGRHHTEQFDINVVGEQLLSIYQDSLRKRRSL